VYEREQYEEKLAKYEAKQAQSKAWKAANVEKAAKRAAAQAKRQLQRQAQAAQTGTVKPAKKSGIPVPPITGPRPGDQVNLTDKESRIMPVSGGGFEQCYNSQAVVMQGTMLVVAAFVTQAPNDKQQVVPMLQDLRELPVGLPAVQALALDTGYQSATNVDACLQDGIEPLIAPQWSGSPSHPHCPRVPRRYKK